MPDIIEEKGFHRIIVRGRVLANKMGNTRLHFYFIDKMADNVDFTGVIDQPLHHPSYCPCWLRLLSLSVSISLCIRCGFSENFCLENWELLSGNIHPAKHHSLGWNVFYWTGVCAERTCNYYPFKSMVGYVILKLFKGLSFIFPSCKDHSQFQKTA